MQVKRHLKAGRDSAFGDSFGRASESVMSICGFGVGGSTGLLSVGLAGGSSEMPRRCSAASFAPAW